MSDSLVHADDVYSKLYASGYPIGNPLALVRKFDLAKTLKTIDLGCGRARMSVFFDSYVGIDVSSYVIDLNRKTREGIYHRAGLTDLTCVVGEFFDLAFCSDVLEHIPPEEVQPSLAEIARLNCLRFAFAISTRPSVLLDHEGENLHLTVWDSAEWIAAIEKDFIIEKSIIAPDLSSFLAIRRAGDPCPKCGHCFDQDSLGIFGCPNCHGEGMSSELDPCR